MCVSGMVFPLAAHGWRKFSPYPAQMFNFHKSAFTPRSQFKHIFFTFLLQFGAERGILTQINTKRRAVETICFCVPLFLSETVGYIL